MNRTALAAAVASMTMALGAGACAAPPPPPPPTPLIDAVKFEPLYRSLVSIDAVVADIVTGQRGKRARFEDLVQGSLAELRLARNRVDGVTEHDLLGSFAVVLQAYVDADWVWQQPRLGDNIIAFEASYTSRELKEIAKRLPVYGLVISTETVNDTPASYAAPGTRGRIVRDGNLVLRTYGTVPGDSVARILASAGDKLKTASAEYAQLKQGRSVSNESPTR